MTQQETKNNRDNRELRVIRVLEIDLTNSRLEIHERTDLAHYLGGTGLAAKLFSEFLKKDLDPLAEEQPIIFANGPLATIFPVATKVISVFRSPLTGEYGESHAGMRLGLAMRGARYDAIVIHGKAKRPTYLTVNAEAVNFKDASAIWGMGVGEVGTILRKLVPGTGHRSSLRIGQAGERKVAFANVNVDTYRHFGRLGLGAVFGAKNLKAMVVVGNTNEPLTNAKEYKQAYEDIYNQTVKTDIMDKYHGLGTAINVIPLNELNALPTKNMQESNFEHAEAISGEAFAEQTLLRQIACSGCPIGCIHIGLHRQMFGELYEYESKSISYDHELIFALGSYLGMSSQDKVYKLIDKVEDLGLDAITAGVALGWVIEAFEKGIIDETLLGTEVAFDEVEGCLHVLENIVKQPNEFYRLLAKGTDAVAEVYGGLDFAMTMGKTEMAGYHTGHAHVIGQSIGARHSHLDNAGYSVDQKHRKDQGKPETHKKMIRELIDEECWRNVLTSVGVCLFARNIYTPERVIKALAATGCKVNEQQLNELGKDIYKLKHRLRTDLGFNIDELRFPKRFFETKSLIGQLSEETIQSMLDEYKQQLSNLLSNVQ
ncbi:aldehyde ferredoxin oxidoreductase N-terminal domain-containing protein [Desulfuribacillus alkaliarsenatis]|uniref:Aldehyde:ferredoxin oxidoreductase n=1 Tax=Desulfuribacillus alkaliarsenatis TaxID=766136 RepID=A0A1E5G454_9FIRM|nr:aldehyde ferredoxin oxidoreductase C-terminal domain-containing protein [Desulfuribacillus alkaliarsenatis]OEF97869.1 aldehyde:ferredoxin oxidoreductase [Desulfuribacillus alkaliarsenatis]